MNPRNQGHEDLRPLGKTINSAAGRSECAAENVEPDGADEEAEGAAGEAEPEMEKGLTKGRRGTEKPSESRPRTNHQRLK